MSYHPLFDSVAVLALTAATVGFTPAASWLRIAFLPVLSALTWHCLLNCPVFIQRSAWASAVGGFTVSSFLHYVDVAVLSGWSFDTRGPSRDLVSGDISTTPPVGPQDTKSEGSTGSKPHESQLLTERIKFGLAVFFSWRFVNTPQQVKNLPKHDQRLRMSRSRFLSQAALTIACCYLLLDLMSSSSDPNISAKFFTPDKVGLFSRLAEVSMEELVMRFFAAVGSCAGLIAFQRGVYNVAAFISVGIRLNSPNDWPPFNGPIRQTYTLRYFWSTFWHQINTHRLSSMAMFLMHNVLHLPRGTILVRYLRIWLIFLFSGVQHVAIDVASGISLQHSGAMRFFWIQPLGLVIEDLFLSLFNGGSQRAGQPFKLWQHFLGWIWVGLWMAWTAPAYLYPIMALEASEAGGVVPVSIIGYAKSVLG
ncbi:hypothetical protein PG997_010215 [Apiospora hydei]|uniref:Wax synthase domain-containing protein n=1 Tax=Apiospora hydei TaxID=1337664 RepID=A0ABR1VWH5_9PEZI